MKLDKLELLPEKPGIYKFLDKDGVILYVGKATNLRNRVKSYFKSDLYDRPRIRLMLPYIDSVEIQQTNNEIESLVLESLLIKKYQPKYNTDLKDDKSYSWIYISTKEVFPTVKIVKKITNSEIARGRLFGPYPSGYTIRRMFSYLRKMYPFCTCTQKQNKECLYFHLGLCPGPYQGHISKEEYRRNINEIIKFLQGKKMGHISKLEKEMQRYSESKQYEKAALLRDRITDMKYLSEKIDFEREDTEESYVSRRKALLKSKFELLKIELGLTKLNRIECYDISNIQGQHAYGSMVVAVDGEILSSEYRIFKIKKLQTPNDPKMLAEVFQRRFAKENLKKYASLPELLLVDGGKTQLTALKSTIPRGITLLGISKGKRFKRKGGRLVDEFWLVKGDSIFEVKVENNQILIELRDEAHRFAIVHHRKARSKSMINSQLEQVPGIGPTRRKELIKTFKDIEGLKKASVDDINAVVKNRKISIDLKKALNT